jgi:hypothetical protein
VIKRFSVCAAFVAYFAVCGCGDSCNFAIVSEAKSPDGKLKAVVFHRGCGSNPIDASEQLSILSSSASSPSGRGNAFIAGDENHTTSTNLKPPIDINVNWESNSSLVVSYPKNAQVFLKRPTVAGVSIRYDAAP